MAPTTRSSVPRTSVRVVALAAALTCSSLFVSCGDALSPQDFAGAYRLVTAGGTPLPLRTVTAGDTQYVFSELLVVEAGGTAHTELVGETRRANGSVEPYRFVSEYATRVEDNHLVMTFICPINALCAPPSPALLYREPDGGVRLEQRGWIGVSRYLRLVEPTL